MKPVIAEGWISVTKRGTPTRSESSLMAPAGLKFFPKVSTTQRGVKVGTPHKVRVTVEDWK